MRDAAVPGQAPEGLPPDIAFSPRGSLSVETLTENGREIYGAVCRRLGCDPDS